MKRLRLLAVGLVCWAVPAAAAEWWQDRFVWEESTQACDDNDTVASYGEKEVTFWEQSCKVEKQTRLVGLEGIILNLQCFGEGEDLGSRRTLLLNLGEGRVASFPPFKPLKRCSAMTAGAAANPAAPPAARTQDCPFNSRLFRSPLFQDKRADSYQELQFLTGEDNGTVELREVRGGELTWTAHGEHTCSNGASICRLHFPLMLGEPISLPYETVENADGGAPEWVVAPAMRQEVYLSQRGATLEGKGYGGLKANLLNGFSPAEDELVLPQNTFRFAECKQP